MNDGFERSLSEQDQAPGALEETRRELRDVQGILDYFRLRIDRTAEQAESNTYRIDRAIALGRSAERLAEAEHERVTKLLAAREFLQEVAAAGDDGPRHAGKPKRDRSHLRVIPGGMAAFGAGALTLGRWSFRRGIHRAVSIATLAAVGTGAGLATEPSLIQGPPPPAAAATVPHRHQHHTARLPPAAAPAPPRAPVTVHLVHHRHRAAGLPSPNASPVPSPHSSTPAPDPDPSPSVTPDPLPSVTVPPLPGPSPSPTCHGHHHCGDG